MRRAEDPTKLAAPETHFLGELFPASFSMAPRGSGRNWNFVENRNLLLWHKRENAAKDTQSRRKRKPRTTLQTSWMSDLF